MEYLIFFLNLFYRRVTLFVWNSNVPQGGVRKGGGGQVLGSSEDDT